MKSSERHPRKRRSGSSIVRWLILHPELIADKSFLGATSVIAPVPSPPPTPRTGGAGTPERATPTPQVEPEASTGAAAVNHQGADLSAAAATTDDDGTKGDGDNIDEETGMDSGQDRGGGIARDDSGEEDAPNEEDASNEEDSPDGEDASDEEDSSDEDSEATPEGKSSDTAHALLPIGRVTRSAARAANPLLPQVDSGSAAPLSSNTAGTKRRTPYADSGSDSDSDFKPERSRAPKRKKTTDTKPLVLIIPPSTRASPGATKRKREESVDASPEWHASRELRDRYRFMGTRENPIDLINPLVSGLPGLGVRHSTNLLLWH